MKKIILSAIFALFIVPSFASASTYIVDMTATGTPDGLSRETAFTSIQAALDIAIDGDVITVTAGTYELNSQLAITKAISLIGEGAVTLKAVTDFGTTNGSKHLLAIYAGTEASPITVSNMTVDCDGKCYGVNTYNNAYGVLNTVTIINSKGAGLTVNGSTITANNMNTSGNAWGSVNVDPGTGVLTASVFTLNSGTLGENNQIWSDGKKVTETAMVTVTAPASYNKYAIAGTSAGFVWTNTLKNVAVITKNDTSTVYATILAALKAAEDGDTIKIAPGNYNLIKDDVTMVSGQAGWYLPITKNNITLVGVTSDGQEITNASGVLANLYSTQETANGSWSTQNLITVFGDNVTVRGLGIMNKISPNKGIEVLGNNFKAEYCQFAPVPKSLFDNADNYNGSDLTKYGSGVYFNNNGATTTRTGTVTNNIFKNSGITFDSFKDNWTVIISNNVFDGNKIWKTGGVDSYYSSIGATTWANQPDFTGSVVNANENQFINMVPGKVLMKIKDGMTGSFNATKNWWGTASSTEIEALLYTTSSSTISYSKWYADATMTTLLPADPAPVVPPVSSGGSYFLVQTTPASQTAVLATGLVTGNVPNPTGEVLGAVISEQAKDKAKGKVLGATAFAFTRNMHFGVRGVEVEELQKMLVAGGHLKLATTTQYFGPLTRAAVIKWQAENKLPATGYFGPMSRAVVVK